MAPLNPNHPTDANQHRPGGIYNVTESGILFQHGGELSTPKDGEEYLERMRTGFSMKVLDRPNENEIVFEMIGIDASFANALRRILIADIPTMAIENVYMWDNTSIIHDEVLAHRLGLIPIHVDARMFDEFPTIATQALLDDNGQDEEHDNDETERATDRNTIVFKIAVTCRRSEAPAMPTSAATGTAGEEDSVLPGHDTGIDMDAMRKAAIETPNRPYTKHVYSSDMEWVPQGDQEARFPNGIRPVHEDILIAKLRPGQSIELEAHAHQGTGKDHAKYSPVATACYRLMPQIELLKDIYDETAEELVYLHEPGVFTLVKTDKSDPPGTRMKAKICNPYACTMSRNFMRNPELAEAIKMTRIPNHFIFSVESVGMMKPAVLVAEALRILQAKCNRIMQLAHDTVFENSGTMGD